MCARNHGDKKTSGVARPCLKGLMQRGKEQGTRHHLQVYGCENRHTYLHTCAHTLYTSHTHVRVHTHSFYNIICPKVLCGLRKKASGPESPTLD